MQCNIIGDITLIPMTSASTRFFAYVMTYNNITDIPPRVDVSKLRITYIIFSNQNTP